MRAVILQHVPFEGPGSIAGWLAERDAQTRTVRLFAGDPLPAPEDFDLLIVLGGPMSVNDEWFHDWLADEKRLIAAAIAQDRAVLGICLGAQLIASALGARVGANEHAEIGWFEISAVAAEGGFALPPRATVLHWHGETFALPDGARLLASSEACRNQAFQLGERVIGLQFHLETTPDSLAELLEACGDEVVPERFVQDEADIVAALPRHATANQAVMADVLAWLTRGLA